jgi:hypothetical protein
MLSKDNIPLIFYFVNMDSQNKKIELMLSKDNIPLIFYFVNMDSQNKKLILKSLNGSI